MFTIDIDNLDLNQIAESGQCFRWRKIGDNTYLIPAFARHVTVSQNGKSFTFSCTEGEFYKTWYKYFDLDTDYKSIVNNVDSSDEFLSKAVEYGSGIRILIQNIWEMIISFIISQNNNIPRIKKSIEALCNKYKVQSKFNEGTDIYSIPNYCYVWNKESLDDKSLGLGYRSQYIWNMMVFNNQNTRFIPDLKKMSYEKAMEYLMTFKGIGKKVANCICLFGLHHLDACPIDTWMQKIIDEEYQGVQPQWMIDKYAGVYQQYAFYYKRAKK